MPYTQYFKQFFPDIDHHKLQNKVPRDRTTSDVADYNNCHDIKWEIKVDDWLKIFMQLFKTTFPGEKH